MIVGIALSLTTMVLYALEPDLQLGQGRARQNVTGTANTDLDTSTPPAPGAYLDTLTQDASSAPLDATAGEVLISVTVTTKSGDDTVVFNGEEITYTITIANNTDDDVKVQILDGLPARALVGEECQPKCDKLTEQIVYSDPRGGKITVTVTTHVSWTIASLAPQSVTHTILTAKVQGKANGSVIENVVSGSFTQNSNTIYFLKPSVAMIVRVWVEADGVTSLSSTPTWFSEDVGGTWYGLG